MAERGLEWEIGSVESEPEIGYFNLEHKDGIFISSPIVSEIYKPEKINFDTGMYKLKNDIFKHDVILLKNGEEFGLPHTIIDFVKKTGTPLLINKMEYWEKINSPEDVLRVKSKF